MWRCNSLIFGLKKIDRYYNKQLFWLQNKQILVLKAVLCHEKNKQPDNAMGRGKTYEEDGWKFWSSTLRKAISISNSDGQPEELLERARVGGKETSQVSTQWFFTPRF